MTVEFGWSSIENFRTPKSIYQDLNCIQTNLNQLHKILTEYRRSVEIIKILANHPYV